MPTQTKGPNTEDPTMAKAAREPSKGATLVVFRRRYASLTRMALVAPVLAILTACGSSGTSNSTVPSARATPTAVARTSSGDIPDTATYLRYRARQFSVEYVEGWVESNRTQQGIRMTNIDSFESVTVRGLPTEPLTAYVRSAGIPEAARQYRHFARSSVHPMNLPGGPAVRLSFRGQSAPDPVTGKQVTLSIDRYFIKGRRHLAIITLATPVGVDNIDAFRRIARSFAWLHE